MTVVRVVSDCSDETGRRYRAGELVELPDAVAAGWMRVGLVIEARPVAPESTAITIPAERAVLPRARPRKPSPRKAKPRR